MLAAGLPACGNAAGNENTSDTAITAAEAPEAPDTAENNENLSSDTGRDMKPDYVLDRDATPAYFEETGDDESPKISFAAAKPLLNYCSENGIPMRVHTLVWHSQTPTWFFKEGYAPGGE